MSLKLNPSFAIPLAALLAVTLGSDEATAQEERTDSISVLDGAYTEEQAAEGETIYLDWCSGCHDPSDFTLEVFIRDWSGLPIFSLFENVRETMPEDFPGGMSDAEYVRVIAYMLQLNGYPAGDTRLPEQEEGLRTVYMEVKPSSGG